MIDHYEESFHHRTMELPDELLKGAIDIHVHAGPHLISSPRRVDPFQAAEMARDAGLRAIVLMDVIDSSTGTAWMVSRKVSGIAVFGGFILSSNYGGLNPRAVKTAMYYGAGAKFVSFGAHSTRHIAGSEGKWVEGNPVLFKDIDPEFMEEEYSRAVSIPLEGAPSSALDRILKIIAENNHVYLNTGHLSGPEGLRLVEMARDYGIKNILVAHVSRNNMTMEERKKAAKLGAFLEATYADFVYPGGIPRSHYYVEKHLLNSLPGIPHKIPGGFASFRDEIREVGPEHYILSSDYGIRAACPPVEALRGFVASLLDLDVENDTITRMISVNPAKLLGMPD